MLRLAVSSAAKRAFVYTGTASCILYTTLDSKRITTSESLSHTKSRSITTIYESNNIQNYQDGIKPIIDAWGRALRLIKTVSVIVYIYQMEYYKAE